MSNLKVILIADADKVGKKGEIKRVSTGYARNFLIPNKIAVLASNHNLKELEEQQKQVAKQAEEELTLYQAVASQLDGYELEIKAKVGDDGKLFGSISASKIVEALKEKGINLKKEQIKLTDPIKEIGEYDLNCELPHGLEAKIKVIVIEESI